MQPSNADEPLQPVVKKARITALSSSKSEADAKADEHDWTTAVAAHKVESERIDRALDETYAESHALENEEKALKALSTQSAAVDAVDAAKETKLRLNEVAQLQQRVVDQQRGLLATRSLLDFERLCLDLWVPTVSAFAFHPPIAETDTTTSASSAVAPARATVALDPNEYPAGYAKPLGEALLQARAKGISPLSTLVIRLDLLLLPDSDNESFPNEDCKPSAVASIPTTTLSTESAMSYIEPLVQYVRTDGMDGMLRSVHLIGGGSKLSSARGMVDHTNGNNMNDIAESFFAAICANTGIVHVHYACGGPTVVSTQSLHAFLIQKAPVLQSLTVDFGHESYSDDNDLALLGNAVATVAAGGSFKSLTIQGMEQDELEPILSILTEMRMASQHGHSTLTLTELKLHWEREVPHECCEELGVLLPYTKGLEHLELSNVRFDGSKLAVILWGLEQRAEQQDDSKGYPCISISKLSFRGCSFDEESTRDLIDFMQTKIVFDNEHDDNEPMFSSSCLRELHLGVDDDEMFDLGDTGLTIASLLQMQPLRPVDDEREGATEGSEMVAGHAEQPIYYSTVGSQIQTLSLTHFASNCVGFFTPLIEAPERVDKLTRLEIREVDEGDCFSLMQCVSKVSSIREVHLADVVRSHECSSILLYMLREHSSLCSFSCSTLLLFTASQRRLVDAYCQRNVYLEQNFGRLDAADKSDRDGDDRNVDRMDTRLHPAFHQAVAHIPNRNSHVFLRNLVTCGQSIGYD